MTTSLTLVFINCWYETDFKSGNKKNVVGSEKPVATAGSSKD
jgi:hypothetical protein